MRRIFLEHFARYPLMGPQDGVKLAYQSAFGGGHLLTDPEFFLTRLRSEWECTPILPRQPLLEELGGGYQRLYLSSSSCKGITPDSIAFLFAQGAQAKPEDNGTLEGPLEELHTLAAHGMAPFPLEEFEIFLGKYRADGCPAIRHSQAYRGAYRPAYRVMSREALRFLPLFRAIDGLLTQSGRAVVAIDGMAAAGKSTLSAQLERRYGCNLIHMDDFFLPPDLRTPERLATPGGNIHHERFRAQVLDGLAQKRPFRYEIFDCHAMAVTHEMLVEPRPLTVIEGAYALHPALREAYDLKVFYPVEPPEQLERIRLRNGEACLPRFRDKWIPLENAYIAACGVRECCDLIL